MTEENVKREYYPNGKLHSERFYNSEGRENGFCRIWHENEQLSNELYYENGLKHGKWFEWRENGSLISERNFNHGKKHGIFRSWDKKGLETTQLFLDDEYIAFPGDRANIFISYLENIGYKIEPPAPVKKKKRKQKAP